MSRFDDVRKAAQERRVGFSSDIINKTFESPKLKIKKLKIKYGKTVGSGQNCAVFLCDQLEKIYDRKNLCIKVFKNSRDTWGHSNVMGQSSIFECTVIQNLMAIRGLAPRVYDLVEINNKIAQITDFLDGHSRAVPIKDDRFIFHGPELLQDHQFIADKLVDFQGVVFKNYKKYKQDVLSKVAVHSQAHSGEGKLYQSIEYLDGWRDTKERLKRYNLPRFDGLRALDIGCNAGFITRELCNLGCSRVVGIDWPNLIEPVKELTILDGYFNIDFYGADLKHTSWKNIVSITKLRKFDVFLYLAMKNHIGWLPWLDKCKILVYEGHGAETEREFKIMKLK